jgi:hypothetical protein
VSFARRLSSLAAAALAGELQDDLKAAARPRDGGDRPESVLVHWSAPTRVFSRDVDYEYRRTATCCT